jgi:pyrroline-5-carboxylate reductase
MKLGFIGTGNLAGFFVEGLARVKAPYDIMVSPRNAEKARDLQQRFGVTISANQEIADSCDIVIVSLLPPDAPAILGGLDFRAGQTVLSVMAGIDLKTMMDLVDPADAAISMMPGLANAHNIGPCALHPENAAALELLQYLGPVHVYDDGAAYVTASVMGAFSGMSTLMLRDAMNWFAANGLDAADARRLVAETLKGNATMLLETPLTMDDVARGVVTPGGITEQGRKILDNGGSWAAALDSILQRLSTRY